MRSNRVKHILDVLLGIGLLLLMSYQVTGEAGHEWTGIGMTVLMILHQILNRIWYAALVKGRYREPSVIDTFMEAYDFGGKTVVPFATSGGSDMGDSAANLQTLAAGAKIAAGRRFDANTPADKLADWAKQWL